MAIGPMEANREPRSQTAIPARAVVLGPGPRPEFGRDCQAADRDYSFMRPSRTRSSSVQRPCDPIIDFRVLMVNVSPLPSVRRHGHAAAVRVAVALVRSALADEIETIAREGGDEFSGRERPEIAIVDGHGQTVTAMRGSCWETSTTSTESSGPSGSGFPSSMNS